MKARCRRKVAISRPLDSAGQGSGEFEEAAAQGRIVDLVIGADQFNRLAATQRIEIEGIGSRFCEACRDRRRAHRIHIVEEERTGTSRTRLRSCRRLARFDWRPARISEPAERSTQLPHRAFLGSSRACCGAAARESRHECRSGSAVALSATRSPGLLLHRHFRSIVLTKAAG